MSSIRTLFSAIALMLLLAGQGLARPLAAEPPETGGPTGANKGSLVIEHVTVLPMTPDGGVLRDQTVTVKDGRIVAIAPSGATKRARDAPRMNGGGKWLMPGLVDAHVHLENDRLMRLYLRRPEVADGAVRDEDVFLPYVAHGILQVIDLSAMSETVGQAVGVEAGRTLGPHVALAAMIDGEPAAWPVGMTRIAASPSDGRQAVRDARAEGYGIIKPYGNLDLATFTAIVDEARRLDMRVVGHIPGRGRGITEKFFQRGFGMVAHAEEFAQQTATPSEVDIPRYVEMARRSGTWLTATLSLDERILEAMVNPRSLRTRPEMQFVTPQSYDMVTEHNPYAAQASAERIRDLERIVAFNAKLVAAFAEAGIPVLAGTDTPVPGLVAGFSLHDELEAMARAGLSNRQVLEGATRLPAEWLGVAADRGTVAVGKRADLLLLDADPLADVANTRRIHGVVVGGVYVSKVELDRRMRELQARYASVREQEEKEARAAHRIGAAPVRGD